MGEFGEIHICNNPTQLGPMITNEDGDYTLWHIPSEGSHYVKLRPIEKLVTGIRFCPFCGERFGEADKATEEIEDELRGALMCVDNIGYHNMTREAVLRAQSIYQALMNGEIQITILSPELSKQFTPQ